MAIDGLPISGAGALPVRNRTRNDPDRALDARSHVSRDG
jgi:hypothetical protein